MSDPLRPKDKPAPRRAEAIQPDKPGQGDDSTRPSHQSDAGDTSLERALAQEKAALDNVRNP